MSQNSMRFSWTFQEVDDRLKTIMTDLYHNASGKAAVLDQGLRALQGQLVLGGAGQGDVAGDVPDVDAALVVLRAGLTWPPTPVRRLPSWAARSWPCPTPTAMSTTRTASTIGVGTDIFKQFVHEGLAEPHDLRLGLALGVEVGAALAASSSTAPSAPTRAACGSTPPSTRASSSSWALSRPHQSVQIFILNAHNNSPPAIPSVYRFSILNIP